MKTLSTTVLTLCSLLAALATVRGLANSRQQVAPAANASKPSEAALEGYHAGPWEQRIGYSQAVRSGRMLYISGTVGVDGDGKPDDLDGQMKNAYAAIQKTLAQNKTDFSHVVMERIFTTDMGALIHSQETRKKFYGEWLPAATWVEVRRLYSPADKIEIEVQAMLD